VLAQAERAGSRRASDVSAPAAPAPAPAPAAEAAAERSAPSAPAATAAAPSSSQPQRAAHNPFRASAPGASQSGGDGGGGGGGPLSSQGPWPAWRPAASGGAGGGASQQPQDERASGASAPRRLPATFSSATSGPLGSPPRGAPAAHALPPLHPPAMAAAVPPPPPPPPRPWRPPPCPYSACPGTYGRCGAPLVWRSMYENPFWACARRECTFRWHPPPRLDRPQVTLEVASDDVLRVSTAPGAEEAMDAAGGLRAVLAAAGVDLTHELPPPRAAGGGAVDALIADAEAAAGAPPRRR